MNKNDEKLIESLYKEIDRLNLLVVAKCNTIEILKMQNMALYYKLCRYTKKKVKKVK